MVEQRSPKPCVVSSILTAPAMETTPQVQQTSGFEGILIFRKTLLKVNLNKSKSKKINAKLLLFLSLLHRFEFSFRKEKYNMFVNAVTMRFLEIGQLTDEEKVNLLDTACNYGYAMVMTTNDNFSARNKKKAVGQQRLTANFFLFAESAFYPVPQVLGCMTICAYCYCGICMPGECLYILDGHAVVE